MITDLHGAGNVDGGVTQGQEAQENESGTTRHVNELNLKGIIHQVPEYYRSK